jgi:hypothetical protein
VREVDKHVGRHSVHTITICKVTMLRFETGRYSGALIHRLVTISGVNRVGDGDGLGVLMLSMMLFCVYFFVLLEVLGSLKGLFTDLKMR